MTLFQSGLRSGESSTVSSAFPVAGNFSGSATVMRPWSISAFIVRYAIRPNFNTGQTRDKAGFDAAEAAVGLALIIAIYRHYKTINVDEVDSMKG